MKQNIFTLAELLEKTKNSPLNNAAVQRAILKYGNEARAIIASGLPSTDKRSNAYKAADRAGFQKWDFYQGRRAGRHRNDGYILIIVEANPATL